MKQITLTDEQYEQLLSELQSLYGYHQNDDTMHADNCGSKVLAAVEAGVSGSTIEAGVSDAVLTEQQLVTVRCMFDEWFNGDMSLPGNVTYGDAAETLRKLGLGGCADSIERLCDAVDPELSDYHGDDRRLEDS